MNEGKYIFTQVCSFIPRQIFQRLVSKYQGDYHVRDFNCTTQLRYMLFGQLTSCESLRDICLCLKAHEDILIKIVQPLYSKMRLEYIAPQDHDLYVLDSTTISCNLKLLDWAVGKYSKGAVKMHTVIDLRGSIPVFLHITDGRYHDSNVLDILVVVPNAIYTMDKAYIDFEALARIDAEKAYFVTRAKANIYRHRWDVESFFKLIKQNLTVKHLLGCSENTVKTHLWIAICSYLLLARIKAVYNSPYSISEIRMLISVSALTKKDLKDLVTEPQPLTTNQDVNELTLF